MEGGMFLAARVRTALLAAALTVPKSAVATESAMTKAQCIAASESGQDLRRTGKLRDARTEFAVCLDPSCPGPIREDCAQHMDEIVKAMPSVVFEVTDSAGNDVPGLAITMDGRPFASSGGIPGAAVDVDPGDHTVSVDAAGFRKMEKRLVAVEGRKRRRLVVIMDRADGAPVARTASPTVDAPTRSFRPPTLAWVAFGVGAGGLTLGTIAGLVAGGKHSTLEGECNNTAGTCTPSYANDLDAFHTWRTVSTAGYVVGVLGVAGGATLWLTAPKSPGTMTARVWLGPASAGVAGRF
jgi:hypothetical protein